MVVPDGRDVGINEYRRPHNQWLLGERAAAVAVLPNQIGDPAHGLRLSIDLVNWIRRWGLDRAHVCQVITPNRD